MKIKFKRDFPKNGTPNICHIHVDLLQRQLTVPETTTSRRDADTQHPPQAFLSDYQPGSQATSSQATSSQAHQAASPVTGNGSKTNSLNKHIKPYSIEP